MLKQLSKIKGPGASSVYATWNPNKLGPQIVLSNENLSCTRTTSSNWGTQLSEQTYSSGIHYVEMLYQTGDSTCLLIGVASPALSNLEEKSSSANAWSL
jgi:hypothetical protein